MANNRKNLDWITIRRQFEAGTPVRKLAKLYGITPAAIYLHKKAEGWVPKNIDKTHGLVAAANPNKEEKENDGIKGVPKGRSIRNPVGEALEDQEAISKFSALTGLSAGETEAVALQAQTEIQVMREHRRIISRASVVAENILTRLQALVIDGMASDVITFRTKKGDAYHRVAFLGDRESVSDALLKCANAISKLVPLERQAHGLMDESKTDKLPTIHFNMPNVKVVSVDGKGKVVKAEDRPAPIESTSEDVTAPEQRH